MNAICSLNNIQQKLITELPRLKAKYHITYLGIFGAYVRNKQHVGSDVDLLIDFDPKFYPGYFDFFALEDHFSTILDIKVNLVTKVFFKKRTG